MSLQVEYQAADASAALEEFIRLTPDYVVAPPSQRPLGLARTTVHQNVATDDDVIAHHELFRVPLADLYPLFKFAFEEFPALGGERRAIVDDLVFSDERRRQRRVVEPGVAQMNLAVHAEPRKDLFDELDGLRRRARAVPDDDPRVGIDE